MNERRKKKSLEVTARRGKKKAADKAGEGVPDGVRFSHDKPASKLLLDFWARAERTLREQYASARDRHANDAGTRGDQGEEDWAAVFRDWLPPRYRIVTKGRIVGFPVSGTDDGATGQIDLIVLHPDYPSTLVNEKLYLLEGVVAAFECKAAAKHAHVAAAVRTARRLAQIGPNTHLTPREYLNRNVLFGLLAHTHTWKKNPLGSVFDALCAEHDAARVEPRDMLDLICISDLGYWGASKTMSVGIDHFPSGEVSASYQLHQAGSSSTGGGHPPQSNIGRVLAALLGHIGESSGAGSRLAGLFRRSNPVAAAGPAYFYDRALPQWMLDKYRARGDLPPHEQPAGWELHYS